MAIKKANRKKKTAKSKPAARKKVTRRKKSARSRSGTAAASPGLRARIHQGLGLKKTGSSPDTVGLTAVEDVDSESVSELLDEGQAFEAGVISGVEDAGDANQGEVKTEEVSEDDVPAEYRDDRDNDL